MSKKWKRHNLKLQRFEQRICPKKYKIIAGIDEAGRGPLAGPVVAAAVVLKNKTFASKIADSKLLAPLARERAFIEIMQKANVGIGIVDNSVIDKENILQATVIAINKALDDLNMQPEYLLIDGKFEKNKFPFLYKTVIKGDSLCFSIACASIVAKVIRDSLMAYYATVYPQYGLNKNKGYGTKEHIFSIRKFGITPIHRKSFKPDIMSRRYTIKEYNQPLSGGD
ncbi:MAG: ribonuclease HII [Candidatus Omnitrophica bacterium]|nr:ribonuclease HII [Candidatus Omnitrophota bacterium]